jgi:polysaccharide biosynthesis transport protein
MRLQGQGLEFQDQLKVLAKRKWSILLITALALGASLFLTSRQVSQYTSFARLLVESEGTLPPNLDTESQLVASVPVARAVIEDLQLGLESTPAELLSRLTVRPITAEGSVIVISYTSTDPEFAAQITDAFAEAYIDYRETQALREVDEATRGVRELITETQQDLEVVIEQLERARAQGQTTRIATLESERTLLATELGALQQRLSDAQLLAAAGPPTGQIIAPAEIPTSPSSPDLTRNLIFAGLAGLATGIGLTFLRERLDDTFKDRFALEEAVHEPVLGAIPRFRISKKEPLPILVRDPTATASEAYRNLRANLDYLVERDDLRTILVTSANQREGKTETVANLGIALARAGQRVALVSADLRRPTLERSFGLGRGKGLSNVLADSELPGAHMVQTSQENLFLITSGKGPKDPVELLGSKRMGAFLEQLRNDYDITILDSPPVLPIADSVVLAAIADATVLVVRSGVTKLSSIMLALKHLEGVGARLAGTVLNGFDPGASPLASYGDYRYVMDKGSAEGEPPPPPPKS